MAQIDQLNKLYYCPLKTNRRVDDSGGTAPYVRVDELVWNAQDLQQGKRIKIRGFPKDKKVKLLGVTVSSHRTEFVATNDLTQADTDVVQDVCGIRWKIEEFHRELKQLTGVEACQCRKARIQREFGGQMHLSAKLSSQSHRLCPASVDSPENDRLPKRQDRLSNQASVALRLPD